MHIVKKVLLLLIIPLVFLVSACSQSFSSAGNALSVSSVQDGGANAAVSLVHQPTGTVILSWNASSNLLTVSLNMTGLTPSSTHPAHIHQASSCQAGGPMLYPLNPVLVNGAGVGTSKTEIQRVTNGIPRQGWIVNVHNGPGLTPADQFSPIACIPVHNYSRSFHSLVVLRYNFNPTASPNQNASGQAKLSVLHHQLTVNVFVHGLIPGSIHMEHIHLGTCAHQGKVLYMLKNLVARKDGTANATTLIPNVAQIPSHGWYLNVHRSDVLSFPNGQINQTNFDPIACGNISG